MTQPRSIEDIRQFLERHFARPVTRRTAERYRDWMVDGFGAVIAPSSTGRKGWAVPSKSAPTLDLSAQDVLRIRRAADWLERQGRATWAQTLRNLSGQLTPNDDAPDARPTEVSALAPSVRVRVSPWVESAIQRAMARNRALQVRYRMTKVAESRKSTGKILQSLIHPYGIVYGERPFLIAGYDVDNRLARDATGHRRLGWYALDRFEQISEAQQPILGRADFDLVAYAQRWFGTPRGNEQPFDVEWKFSPAVAARAALYEFHPTQRLERLDDGSLVVRFTAAGSLEMRWHLARWGDSVELMSPKRPLFDELANQQEREWRAYFG